MANPWYFLIFLRRLMTSSAVSSSRFASASSARRSFGFPTRARTIASRCCCPPERRPVFW